MLSEGDSSNPGSIKRLHSDSPLKEEKGLKVQKVGLGEANMDDIAMLATEMKRMNGKMDQQTERLEDALRRVKTELSGEIGQLGESVGKLQAQVDLQAKEIESVKSQVGMVQTVATEDRARITALEAKVGALTHKTIDMEDRSRRNNVRLIGLAEGAEGTDAVGFLQTNLPKWFPSMKGRLIEVDRAHRVYGGGTQNAERPRSLIFRLLRWRDRDAILTAAKKRGPPVRYGNSNLLFFADYSASTTAKRKTFGPAMKMAHGKGFRPFLVYPATLKIRLGTGPKLFDDPASALEFIRRQPPAGDNTGTRTAWDGARRNLFTDGPRDAETARVQEAGTHVEDITDP